MKPSLINEDYSESLKSANLMDKTSSDNNYLSDGNQNSESSNEP
jgi:hypothetical protein